jgi:hypothetical protein
MSIDTQGGAAPAAPPVRLCRHGCGRPARNQLARKPVCQECFDRIRLKGWQRRNSTRKSDPSAKAKRQRTSRRYYQRRRDEIRAEQTARRKTASCEVCGDKCWGSKCQRCAAPGRPPTNYKERRRCPLCSTRFVTANSQACITCSISHGLPLPATNSRCHLSGRRSKRFTCSEEAPHSHCRGDGTGACGLVVAPGQYQCEWCQGDARRRRARNRGEAAHVIDGHRNWHQRHDVTLADMGQTA